MILTDETYQLADVVKGELWIFALLDPRSFLQLHQQEVIHSLHSWRPGRAEGKIINIINNIMNLLWSSADSH